MVGLRRIVRSFRDENTVREWDAIVELRKDAIALLESVPTTETVVYDSARKKILVYEDSINTNQEFRLHAPFLGAVRKANAADEARSVARTSGDWREVAGLWGGAAQQMAKVTTEDRDRWATAQKKIIEYTTYQTDAREQANDLADRELLGE